MAKALQTVSATQINKQTGKKRKERKTQSHRASAELKPHPHGPCTGNALQTMSPNQTKPCTKEKQKTSPHRLSEVPSKQEATPATPVPPLRNQTRGAQPSSPTSSPYSSSSPPRDLRPRLSSAQPFRTPASEISTSPTKEREGYHTASESSAALPHAIICRWPSAIFM